MKLMIVYTLGALSFIVICLAALKEGHSIEAVLGLIGAWNAIILMSLEKIYLVLRENKSENARIYLVTEKDRDEDTGQVS